VTYAIRAGYRFDYWKMQRESKPVFMPKTNSLPKHSFKPVVNFFEEANQKQERIFVVYEYGRSHISTIFSYLIPKG